MMHLLIDAKINMGQTDGLFQISTGTKYSVDDYNKEGNPPIKNGTLAWSPHELYNCIGKVFWFSRICKGEACKR